MCHGTAMIGNCGKPVKFSGPCVLRPHDESSPCYGEDDVASGWSPVSSCPRCCVCPCGSLDASADPQELCRYCRTLPTPGLEPACTGATVGTGLCKAAVHDGDCPTFKHPRGASGEAKT